MNFELLPKSVKMSAPTISEFFSFHVTPIFGVRRALKVVSEAPNELPTYSVLSKKVSKLTPNKTFIFSCASAVATMSMAVTAIKICRVKRFIVMNNEFMICKVNLFPRFVLYLPHIIIVPK